MDSILLLVILILVAFLISFIFLVTRNLILSKEPEQQSLINGSISWSLVFFSFLLGFSISNFYNRYIDIRDTFVLEINQLRVIFNILKMSGTASIDPIRAIKKYLINFTETQIPILKAGEDRITTDQSYSEMNERILEYVKENSTPINTAIGFRLSTNERIKKLVKEISINKFFLTMVIVALIFTLATIWFVKINDNFTQLIIEFCIFNVIFVGIYLLIIFSNPFTPSPVSIQLDTYHDFLNEINTYLNRLSLEN